MENAILWKYTSHERQVQCSTAANSFLSYRVFRKHVFSPPCYRCISLTSMRSINYTLEVHIHPKTPGKTMFERLARGIVVRPQENTAGPMDHQRLPSCHILLIHITKTAFVGRHDVLDRYIAAGKVHNHNGFQSSILGRRVIQKSNRAIETIGAPCKILPLPNGPKAVHLGV